MQDKKYRNVVNTMTLQNIDRFQEPVDTVDITIKPSREIRRNSPQEVKQRDMQRKNKRDRWDD